MKTGKTESVEGEGGDTYLQSWVYRTPWGILAVCEDITEKKADNAFQYGLRINGGGYTIFS
ncbi:MAG: hypothetical protein U5N86_07655 [Planctomycetota bacterium]|nr:hypothetical protein [Planctomycetota bacterium]